MLVENEALEEGEERMSLARMSTQSTGIVERASVFDFGRSSVYRGGSSAVSISRASDEDIARLRKISADW